MSPPRIRPVVVDGRIITRPQCRGIGRSVIGLVGQFPTDAADGSVKVLVERGGSTPFDLSGVARRAELIETDLPVIAVHRAHAIRTLLRDLDAGVLFSPYHPLTPLAPPCAVVSAVHDCMWEEDPAFAGGRARQLAYLALTRVSLQRTSAITVPSMATAHAVHRYYPHVAATEVVPNGVSLREAGVGPATTVEATRAALGLPSTYLLHVGARRPHKNQRLLLELLTRLDPAVGLVLVGTRDPRMADEIDDWVLELGVGSRVLMLDNVADDHMPGLYAGAAAFVFPSLVEGYGIPPLEAMVAGTPVVASAIPALAEVCQDGAILASPFDLDAWVVAVEGILSDPGSVVELTKRGLQVAERSTWERGGTALHRLLRRFADAA